MFNGGQPPEADTTFLWLRAGSFALVWHHRGLSVATSLGCGREALGLTHCTLPWEEHNGFYLEHEVSQTC